MADKPKPKKLSSAEVLCRVRGIGQAEAVAMCERLGIAETTLADAYGNGQSGTEAVERLLNSAADKLAAKEAAEKAANESKAK